MTNKVHIVYFSIICLLLFCTKYSISQNRNIRFECLSAADGLLHSTIKCIYQDKKGFIIPVIINVYVDRTFSFITKTPPTSELLKKACKIQKASGEPNRIKVGKVSKKQIMEIAKAKMPDLNAGSLESVCAMVEGTAKSMGIELK